MNDDQNSGGLPTDPQGSKFNATEDAAAAAARWADAQRELFIASLGVRPMVPKELIIEEPNQAKLRLPAGMYLCYGGTGSGKSLTTVALVALMKRMKKNAFHMYCYEARGPKTVPPNDFLDALSIVLSKTMKEKNEALGAALQAAMSEFAAENRETVEKVEEHAKLLELYNQMKDLLAENDLAKIAAEKFIDKLDPKGAEPSFLVIDSLSIPMRSYGANVEKRLQGEEGEKGSKNAKWVAEKSRRGEPTMPGGLQPSDISFCEQMEALAVANNIIIVGVVNFDLVPFVDKLEAVVEGFMSIESAGVMAYRQRATRRPAYYYVKEIDKQIALAYLNYGKPDGDLTGTLGISLD